MGQLFADAARAYLSAGINDTDTTISITAGGALFPVANGADWFKAVLQDASGIEIVYVTAHTSASTSFTVTRGQEGTTARSFAAGSVFGLRVTAADTAAFAGKLGDAPSDGKTYGRKDAAWAEVATGATYRVGDVQIAPTAPATGTWLLCDGAAYLQASYTALYAELGIISNSPGALTALVSRSLPTTANWNAVTYGNGVFVAVSTGTVAATSTDGVTWTSRTLPSSNTWTGVAYGNGIFVAVATGTTAAASSPDGITWTAGSMPSSSNWNAVTYGNGVFVAVSNTSGTVAASSTNGTSWTARTLPATTTWYSVTYGNGVFVATGATTVAATSNDGTTWAARTLPASGQWRGVTYGNGVFVAVRLSGTDAATSQDGISWTLRTLPSSSNWQTVGYSGGTFLAVATSSNVAASSPDGIVWTPHTLPASASWAGVSGNGPVIVAVSGGSVNYCAQAFSGVSYDPSTQFAVPKAISDWVSSWIKAS